jgi:DNA repair exonuclease SbcCD ATPase subunit
LKKFRKCDTTKHRRRMKKQRENTAAAKNEARQRRRFEATGQVARATSGPAAVACPLCGVPFDLKSWIENRKVIAVNGRPVPVHRVCPKGAP